MNNRLEKEISDIFASDRYYNGAMVGDREVCPKCGGRNFECISDEEHPSLGIHTWRFRCSDCQFEDGECW